MAKKGNDIEVAVAEVVDYMRMTGTFAPALREVITRKVTAEAAKKKGIKVSTKELQKAADTFRIANGMSKASDTERWLKSNGVSLESLEDFLETNLLINKFKDSVEKRANKKKYLSSQGIKESVREMAYLDWLRSAVK